MMGAWSSSGFLMRPFRNDLSVARTASKRGKG